MTIDPVPLKNLCDKCRKGWERFVSGEQYGFLPCPLCDDKLKMTLAATTDAN